MADPEDLTPTGEFPAVGPPGRRSARPFEAALTAATQALIAAPDPADGDGPGRRRRRPRHQPRRGCAGRPRTRCRALPLDDPAAALHALGRTLQRRSAAPRARSTPCSSCAPAAPAHRRPDRRPARPGPTPSRPAATAIAELGGAGRGDRTMLDALAARLRRPLRRLAAGRPVADALAPPPTPPSAAPRHRRPDPPPRPLQLPRPPPSASRTPAPRPSPSGSGPSRVPYGKTWNADSCRATFHAARRGSSAKLIVSTPLQGLNRPSSQAARPPDTARSTATGPSGTLLGSGWTSGTTGFTNLRATQLLVGSAFDGGWRPVWVRSVISLLVPSSGFSRDLLEASAASSRPDRSSIPPPSCTEA